MNTILDNIKDLVCDIEYKTQLIGRNQRLTAGIYNTRYVGIISGILVVFIIVLACIYFLK